MDNENKMFRCFVLVDETEKGDMNSPARLLIFMRWCRVLAGDISLRVKRGQRGEQRGMTDQSGDGDFVIHGSAPFLQPARKL